DGMQGEVQDDEDVATSFPTIDITPNNDDYFDGDDDFSLDDLFDDSNEGVYDDIEYTEDEEADADFLDALFLDDDSSVDNTLDEAMPTTAGNNTASPPSIGTQISLDSLSSDLSYFYLRDELGLSEDVMWNIMENAPSVLGFKADTVRNKVQVLQSLMGLSDEDVRQVISAQPALLHLSAKKNISPTVLFLQRQLQVSKKELRTLLLGCPTLLNYSRANLNAKIVNFFQNIMGFTVAETRRLLLKEPKVLRGSVKTGLIPRLLFLHKEVQISSQDLRTIVKKNPRILAMNVDQNLQPKLIFFFILTLRMEPRDVSKLLVKYPQVLNYSLERHIMPIYQYFTNTLDLSTLEFVRILKRYPRLLTYSLTRIKRRLGYLRFELQLNAESIRRILYQSPQVISLSQENVETTVKFLLEAVAPNATQTLDPDENYVMSEESLEIVQTVVSGMPSLLGLNIETSLQPKVDYLKSNMGQEAFSRALLKSPLLLGYSLEKRIQPRMEMLLQGGVDPEKITIALPFKEEAFEAWLKGRIANAKQKRKAEEKQRPPMLQGTKAEEPKKEEEIVIETPRGKNKVVVKDGGRILQWKRDERETPENRNSG
ncbi:MAG: hypothetical protein SGILL_007355, partial [Bacillariaceae sp.]